MPRSIRFVSRLVVLSLLAAAVALWAGSAQAIVYYWDTNGDVGFGSITGAWDGVNLFWNTDITGATSGTFVASPTSADDLNINGGTTGTISITGAQVASSLTFGVDVAATISGGTSLTVGGTGASSGIYVASGDNAANAISTALILNGNNTFQTAGTGVLTLSGGVTGAGNLILNNNSTNAAGITISTASLDNTGTITNSGIGTGGTTISSVIGPAVTGVVQNSATSALTLSGANSYGGGTIVNAGTLALSGSGTLGATTGALTADGGTAIVNLGGTTQTVGAVSLKNGAQINSGTLTGTSFAVESGSASAILDGAGVS